MAESGSMAFLQQAHRNNWQRYLDSLKDGARIGWDVCVLTASDERQAAMYGRQLDWRREAGLLPATTRFVVIPDPGGRRIGSGGATLRALAQAAPGAAPAGQRILMIHSGGDSRRLPHCSASGKLFARVPRSLPDGRASTIFDEFLISLSGLAAEAPAGALIASGDVLLIFDHLQLSFHRGGVIGVAAAAPAEMGRRHGVYASGARGHRVRAYLHKPSAAELAAWGAVDPDGAVQIDTGLVWLDAASIGRLLALTADPAVGVFCGAGRSSEPGVGLNLYGDVLLPLADSTTFEDYLADASDGPATADVQAARRIIWDRLRGISFTVERLQPAVFLHFGASYEYWRMAAGDPEFARTCGWSDRVASWTAAAAGVGRSGPVLINSCLETMSVEAPASLIVDSRLEAPVAARGPGILAGVQTAQPLALGEGLVLHQAPVAGGGFVTSVYGLHDDPKRGPDDPAAAFLNRPFAHWLAEAGFTADLLWPDVTVAERTLWNARLYPHTDDREESLRLSLPLCDPAHAAPGWRDRWMAAPRLSLAAGFAQADGERMLAELAGLEDRIAARRFYAAVVAEQPTAEATSLLGAVGRTATRRGELAGDWLAAADPILQLRGYRAVAEATGDPAWEDRAFAALAAMVERATIKAAPTRRSPTSTLQPPISNLQSPPLRVSAAARIDFGGGWTDTPPYSIERGGSVLNAAVTLRGEYPIVAEAQWLAEPRLILESRDIEATLEPMQAGEVLAYANPADPFALPKAALVLRGIVPADMPADAPLAELWQGWGRGLRLSTSTRIPRGSGLGTSSILAGAVLVCLEQLLARDDRRAGEPANAAAGWEGDCARLFDEVLCLEQMLTTGGGWQDQVGGLTGGIKLVSTRPGLPQEITVEPVALSPATSAGLAERLLLIYTGQQRLAKNLLRAIMGRWMARDPEMVWMQGEIARLGLAMRDALQRSDLDGFGRLLSDHWLINKRMDPGCTNPFIDDLFRTMTPYISGGKLAGAGGGGFVMAIARDRQAGADLDQLLAARYPGAAVGVWPCAVPAAGLKMTNDTGAL